MTSEIYLVADARQAERSAKLTQRAIRPQMPTLRLLRTPTSITRPTLNPIVPRKDTSPVNTNTIYFGNQSQLIVAETRHQEMVRNAMLRQQLRDARVTDASLVTSIRGTVAKALFTLAQVVKPAGEIPGPATNPRPVA